MVSIIYLIDIFVLFAIATAVVIGYKNGLLKSFVRLCGQVLSLILSYLLYPSLSRIIREYTGIFDVLKDYISASLGIESLIVNSTQKVQTDFINSMNLPPFIKSSLLENNNPVIHNTLNVDGLTDYISGYLANICINIITLIVVFIVIQIIMEAITVFSGIVSHIPLIGSVNRILGGTLGFLQGLLGIWIMFVILTFFVSVQAAAPIFDFIDNTYITKFLYTNNLLWFMIAKVFV